jgi:hypothetical protein
MVSIDGLIGQWVQELSRTTMGILLVLFGLAFAVHARHLMRKPDWQVRGWWANHPRVARLVGGTGRLARAGVWFEMFGALLLLIAGLVTIVAVLSQG